ncbi:MAG TPA: tripartite tricarboxylate transporter substrate binding protein [Burkholderiales bacterium]|nr:tripartite tricarboxylate transporter substrate binding protein [Burkholderiales bacterium]
MKSLFARRRFLLACGAALGAAAGPRIARAQQWPRRPIRAIVPFSVGSSIDIIARIVLEPLAAQLGQPIVVENRGGAGGTVGAHLVAQAEPDGHTWLIHASAHTLTPVVYPRAPYSTEKDFAAVASLGSVPNVILVSPKRGIRTLKELAALGKKGQVSFSSAGMGSASHWAAERFRLSAGFDALHVPFKGGPEALIEVVTGRVDFVSPGLSVALPFVRDGRLLPLAVSTPKRSSALPDVPTTLEAGFPDSDYTFWNAVFVPVKTPRAIVERLHRELQQALALPQVKEKLAVQGIEPMPLSPAEFDALVRKEIATNLAVAKAAKLAFN